MWLTNSSIGRKLVMAITGACLVLFVTFHVLMNGVAIFWPAAYNAVCEFLGANWYALVASIGLAALFIIHICYAVWLILQNRKARGNDPYKVTSRPPQVEWSSKNMLVLGIVILAFLLVHLYQFWAKMQFAEIAHCTEAGDPANGMWFIYQAFSCPCTLVIYLIGFIALWFHLNHGFWSMFQSAGWNNGVWMPRLKTIGCWWTTLVVGLFVVEACWFTFNAMNGNYEKLQVVKAGAPENATCESAPCPFDACGQDEKSCEKSCEKAQPCADCKANACAEQPCTETNN